MSNDNGANGTAASMVRSAPARRTPRQMLNQLRLSESAEERLEMREFDMLPMHDKAELLYRMLNRLAIATQQHAQQFPLIDAVCNDFASAIEDLQKRMEVTT